MNILTTTRTFLRGCRTSSAAVVLGSAFFLAGAPGQAFADIEPHTGPCIQPASGEPHLNCTANDLTLGALTVTNADGDCKTNPDGHWTLDGYITVPADTTTRYDLGFYIGEDGIQALTGTCWVDMIEDDPEEPLDIWRDEDGDACGDHPAGEAVAIQVHGVVLRCADADGDAYADAPICVSYDNNSQVNCFEEEDAIPANDAKCQCFTVNTDVRIGCETNADCPADMEVCTTAVCLGSGQPGADLLGCSQQNNTEPCDDGVFCNGTDVCAGGACGHSGDPCDGGGVCEACNEADDNCFVAAGTPCRASAGVCDVAENCTGSSTDCPADGFVSSATMCRASAGVCDVAENCTGAAAACPADVFTSSATVCRASAGVCDVAENCTGSVAACPADAMLSSATVCRVSAGICDMTDYCTGSAAMCPADAKQPDGTSCDEGLFCTDNECLAGACETTPHDCSDDDPCTEDTCNETADACDYEWICVEDICRSAGYWANHSGYEKAGKSINVAQMLLDEVGPLEVCGQTVSATSNETSPYLEGLGLTSDLQGLCMRAKGVQQRQLYRQLTAAALNCAISGHADDCDAVVGKYVDVSFSDCSDLCAGNPPLVDPPTMGECKTQLDCFNNGGRMIVDVGCALGTCAEQPELYCGHDAGPCPDFEAMPQECVRFQGNCHSTPLCNEEMEFCPKNTATSSTAACHEAKFDSCTIDSCD